LIQQAPGDGDVIQILCGCRCCQEAQG
jgi:hypothetical protein